MGAGSSLEAAFTLRGPIPAGTWRLVGDGIALESVDVSFELIWRHGTDDVVVRFDQSFEPLPGEEYRAQAYEDTADLDPVDAAAGDQLVLRITGESASLPMAYIPNGDGELTDGRIPFVDLPR